MPLHVPWACYNIPHYTILYEKNRMRRRGSQLYSVVEYREGEWGGVGGEGRAPGVDKLVNVAAAGAAGAAGLVVAARLLLRVRGADDLAVLVPAPDRVRPPFVPDPFREPICSGVVGFDPVAGGGAPGTAVMEGAGAVPHQAADHPPFLAAGETLVALLHPVDLGEDLGRSRSEARDARGPFHAA
eukprot:COSAG05_NODE_1010_length_6207_cov_3.771447_11_plen_185_part_00